MLKLARINGVKIVPAMPGFYSKPESVADIVNAVVMRVVDQMGEKLNISGRWE
jgi:4-hydroxy-3-polyprenylbenzoate decarboxylase